MIFNEHFQLKGQHAFLSASKYHWIGYDIEKLMTVFKKHQAKKRGTELHDLADRLISLKEKLPRSRKTLNQYVNDAIGFNMKTEQILCYSENCFGTVDAISFKKNRLRIHDLKTGETPASIKQLMVYAALFCLEYKTSPNDIEIELRLYQSDDIIIHDPSPEEILYIMNKIIEFDKQIELLKMEG